MKGTLHHVELYVSNLANSTQFWGWFLGELGYTLFQSWKEGVSYRLGDTYLVFVQTEAAFLADGYHRKRTGLNHLAFHAASREMVDDMAAQLKTKGVKLLYETKHPYAGGENYYALYFEDPDRIKVELVAPQKPA